MNSTTPSSTQEQSSQRGYYDFAAFLSGVAWDETMASSVTTGTSYDVQFDFTWNPLSDGQSYTRETVFQTHHTVSVLFGSELIMAGDLVFPNTPDTVTTVSLLGSKTFSDPEGLYPVLITRTGILVADSDEWGRLLDIGNPDEWERSLDIGNPEEELPSAPAPSALILVCTGIAGVVCSRRRGYSNS
ncbi:hypothetical protein ACFL3F_00100 [Planctomycetota bacterium]